MENKVMLITGANSGIGKATATELAKEGHTIVMVCRDQTRGEQAKLEVERISGNKDIYLMICDLSILDSIRQFCMDFKSQFKKVDVLIHNAGVMTRHRSMTKDGFEMQFQVNYLGPVLLNYLLLDVMGAGGRIIHVSSLAHKMGDIHFDDIHLTKRYSMMRGYAQSKLALVLYTYHLSKQLESSQITVNCLHPGIIISNLGMYKEKRVIHFITRKLKRFFTSELKGAQTSIYLANSPLLEGVTGKYFYKQKPIKSSKTSYNQNLITKLSRQTEAWLGINKGNQELE